MGLGLLLGLAGGFAIVRLVNRLDLESGLYPIVVLAASLVLFGIAGALHCSGFLAVYVAGPLRRQPAAAAGAGAPPLPGRHDLARADRHVRGLRPARHAVGISAASLLPGIALGVFLIFVARPVAVWLCLWPFRFQREETTFVAWVGLRGAVSLLLGILPLMAALPRGQDHLQRHLHHRARLARRAGLDDPADGAPARPDHPADDRPGGQGGAGASRHRASRARRLSRGGRQPGRARRAHPALGAAVARRAQGPVHAPAISPAASRPTTTSISSPRRATSACSTGSSPAPRRSRRTTRTSSASSTSTRATRSGELAQAYGVDAARRSGDADRRLHAGAPRRPGRGRRPRGRSAFWS